MTNPIQESEQQAKNSATWLLWRRAAEAVEKVRKDAGSKLCQGMPQNLLMILHVIEEKKFHHVAGNRLELAQRPVADFAFHADLASPSCCQLQRLKIKQCMQMWEGIF